MSHPRVLVIDDQFALSPGWRSVFLKQSGRVGRPVREARVEFVYVSGQIDGRNDVASTLDAVRRGWTEGERWALVLLDVRFDDPNDADGGAMFGFRLLDAMRLEFGTDLPIIMLTSEDSGKRRLANERAADDFIAKDDLSAEGIERLLFRVGLVEDDAGVLRGCSLPLLKVLRAARRGAEDRVARGCLLLGETGTGKSELARYVHRMSARGGAFVRWGSTRNNDALNEDALFGHWRGAHSEASASVAGAIERANGGTFFLDEIGNLSQRLQESLLEVRRRVQGMRTIRRLGTFPTEGAAAEAARRSVRGLLKDDHCIGVDVDWINATNERLDDPAVRERLGFRDDLYADLGKVIRIPPLNDRRDDVPLLFRTFVDASLPEGVSVGVREEVWEALAEVDWSGSNVVGVQRMAEATVQNLGSGFDEILLRHLPRTAPRTLAVGAAVRVDGDAPSFEALLALLEAAELPRERERLWGLLSRYQRVFARHALAIFGNALRATVDRRGRSSTLAALSWVLGRERLTAEGRGETTKSYDVLKRIVQLSDVGYQHTSAASVPPLTEDPHVLEHIKAALAKR